MTDSSPFLSVVTPVLNRAEFIAQAIESVSRQTGGVSFEHIVVDGGSLDGTQEVVRKYPHVTLVERLDGGIYGAFNEGVRLARGGFVGILNSDDAYLPGAFAALKNTIEKNAEADCYAGGAIFSSWGDDDKTLLKVNDEETKTLDLHALAFDTLLINARFFRRGWLEKIGPFDESYTIAGDRELLWRCRRDGIRIICLPNPIYRYRLHEGSQTLNASNPDREWRDEHLRLCRALLSNSLDVNERRMVLRWHGVEVSRQVLDELKNLRLFTLASTASRAFHADSLWPARVLEEGIQRLKTTAR